MAYKHGIWYIPCSSQVICGMLSESHSMETLAFLKPIIIVRTLNPKKCNFNAPAIRKNFVSKFDKYNILAL